MTTEPTWTDEEKFWLAVRRSLLGLVDAIESHKLDSRIMPTTAEARKWLRSYQLVYPFQPIAAEIVQERIEELRAEERLKKG